MTVHFIGAGPGAADLITVRGRDLLGCCPVCLYAGSIVSPQLLAHCPADARVVDTAPMSLDQIEAELQTDRLAVPHQQCLGFRDLRGVGALVRQKTRALHAFPRQIGIQLERTPRHVRLVLRPRRQREFKAALAEVAPGANRVAVDVYSHSRAHAEGIVPAPYGL